MNTEQYNQVENDMQFAVSSGLLSPGRLDLDGLKIGEIG